MTRKEAKAASRAAILAAARELYLAHGWEAVTSRMIGKRAGVAASMVVTHWPSLADLFHEAMGRPVITDAMGAAMAADLAYREKLTVGDVLRCVEAGMGR